VLIRVRAVAQHTMETSGTLMGPPSQRERNNLDRLRDGSCSLYGPFRGSTKNSEVLAAASALLLM